MKAILLSGLGILTSLTLAAQVEGPNNPTAFTNYDLPGYSNQWIDIDNVGFDDEAYATFGNLPGTKGTYTDYLMVTDFKFDIPPGTIIKGIKVEVECSDPKQRTADYSVRIVKAGAVTGDDKAMEVNYPLTDKYLVYGDIDDLWGETWDNNSIDDSQFGVAIAAQRSASDDIPTMGQVNNIRITVYYTFIILPVTLNSFSAVKDGRTVRVDWTTASESYMQKYTVERSANGSDFSSIQSIPALNGHGDAYRYIDYSPLAGTSFYRLKMTGDGSFLKYSNVATVKFDSPSGITMYPNVWQSGSALNINNTASEKLTIYFINSDGQVLSNVTTQSNVVPTSTLGNLKGVMYYRINDTNNKQVGSGKFMIL